MAAEENKDLWFICTRNFVCQNCGKSNSKPLPVKSSDPANYELIKLALRDQPFLCEDCREPSPVVTSDEFEIVRATPSETAAFESDLKS